MNDAVEFVVVRSDVFDRLSRPPVADHAELREMLGRASAGNGWDDPGMEAYDAYPTAP
jgi:hypothetical protein